MSGHNKWSKIKRQKEKTDAEKSKIYGKLVRMISVEAKLSNGVMSPGLKTAIEKAREANVPNDNIERALKRANESENDLETIIYEAYGPGGSALIIEALTANRNKAAQEIKHILSAHGITLASIGSATWAFEKTNEGWLPKTTVELQEKEGLELENIVDELEANDEVQNVFTNAV